MIFAESSARFLLILHTVFAVACVGASTHLVIWLRGYRRGQFTRVRAVRRFAWLSLTLYAITFLGGNVIYPTYKVRVRGQFLDDPVSIVREVTVRQKADARSLKLAALPHEQLPREHTDSPMPAVPATETPVRRTAKMARWFDTKEHWVALGFALTVGLTLMLAAWKPRHDPSSAVLGPIVFWLAVSSAGVAWLAAIIGVLVSSFRAIGSL